MSIKGVFLGAALVLGVVGCGRPGPAGPSGPVGPQGLPGQDGEDGIPGQAAIIEIIDPCGDAPGIYDEVVLRLANGQLLTSFSDSANGKNTRFSILVPGNYTTTDGSGCQFGVNEDGEVF